MMQFKQKKNPLFSQNHIFTQTSHENNSQSLSCIQMDKHQTVTQLEDPASVHK